MESNVFYLKYFNSKIILIFSVVLLTAFNTFTTQDFTTVTNEQVLHFLKQWPECTVNKNTKRACNKEITDLKSTSLRKRRNFFQIVNSYQDVAILAGKTPEEAQKKTEKDFTTFFKTEFSADVPGEVDPQKYPELVKFIRKYGFPRIYCKEAEKYKESIEYRNYGVAKDFPSFFLKNTDIDRIINAERMRRCIEIHNLDQLDVPQKYLGKVGNTWRVFAENINSPRGKIISLKETQQLAKVAEETGFSDWRTNWNYDDNNKFVCIDTENSSFYCWRDCKLDSLITLWRHFHTHMEKEAQGWLVRRIEELENSPEGKAQITSLNINTKYDDPDIDFEKVKEEFAELKRSKNI